VSTNERQRDGVTEEETKVRSTPRSRRTAVGFLLLGAGLVLAGGWFLLSESRPWEHPRSPTASDAPTQPRPQTPSRRLLRLRAAQLWLITTLILVLAFAFGSYAIVLLGRRLRQMLARRPAPPTDVRDIWRMHRLPEEPPSSQEEPPRD